MSTRVDTLSLIPGSTVCGHRGLGVLGSTILLTTSDGDNGPGILYNDVQPGDEDKEFRAFVANPPPGIFIYEDGSFVYDGASTSFSYELLVDGVTAGVANVSLSTAATPSPDPVHLAATGAVYCVATAFLTTGDAPSSVHLVAEGAVYCIAEAMLNVGDPTPGPAPVYLGASGSVFCIAAAVLTIGGVIPPGSLQGFSSKLRTIVVKDDALALRRTFFKRHRERLDYRFDFTQWLADCEDEIASHTAECDGPLSVVEVAKSDGSVIVLTTGGGGGPPSRLICTIFTTGGRRKEYEVLINVSEC